MLQQAHYDSQSIRALFDEMAATYGTINLITSFGFSARWRRQAVKNLPDTHPAIILDLMSGMGEICLSVAKHLPTTKKVLAVDISPEMLRRAGRNYPFEVIPHLQDVLTWQPEPASADAVLSSFGLKTFDSAQQVQLARQVAALLRPGGTFSFVEISVPPNPLLRGPYLFYLKRVIPLLGRLFLGNPANYCMLGIYTEAFGNCGHFQKCLRQAGLEATSISYFFGCASGVHGRKPANPS